MTKRPFPAFSNHRLRIAGLLALSVIWAVAAAPASASTIVVDGISDQSIPYWDSGFSSSFFAGFFKANWVSSSHIRYARYVVQWNATVEQCTHKPCYREEFEEWLNDVASMGLTTDVGLTSYTGRFNSGVSEYKERLKEILSLAEALKHPISYVEAWNEPNNQGKLSPERAAELTNAASSACEAAASKCKVVAGDFEDSRGVKGQEEKYRKHLSPVPSIWGLHPYYTVETMSESHYEEALQGLPSKGKGDQVWITEVAARECTPTTEIQETNTERGETYQALRAEWLVNTLIKNKKPEHVFYYEFLLNGHRQPSCGEFDDALYVPSGDPNAEDRPHAAASYVFDDEGTSYGPDRTFAAANSPLLGIGALWGAITTVIE